jgi:hypothetical protein
MRRDSTEGTPETGTGAIFYMKQTMAAPPMEEASQSPAGTSGKNRAGYEKVDPIRRFVATPYTASLPAMGRKVRLETNSPTLLEHMVNLFAQYSGTPYRPPEFRWRIVVESGLPCSPPWPWRSAFSDKGIRFAHFGQRNFLAVDIDAREAVGFVSEGLFEDRQGFSTPFIDTLFYMSAAPLGLMPFASACVSLGNLGLLVLGEPNQGKTTASYLAARTGLTVHSDQSVFLELVNDELRAWGDFVPLAFRPETLLFLPELQSRTRPFAYCDFHFHYLPKHHAGPALSPLVTPTCCVVLERGASYVPRLDTVDSSDLRRYIARYLAFKDEDRFEDQNRSIVAELAQLPAYRLAYGIDPADAAPFFRCLLMRHGGRVKSA